MEGSLRLSTERGNRVDWDQLVATLERLYPLDKITISSASMDSAIITLADTHSAPRSDVVTPARLS